MSSGSFDWKSLQKYLNPQAADDFSRFMDTVPAKAGNGALIAAGIAWGAVAALALFSMMQGQVLTELRGKLQSTEALKPVVPVVTAVPAPQDQISRMIEQMKQAYPDLTVNANGDKVTVQSKKTADFIEFREALGHVINGGPGWKVILENLCVGRECKQNALDASLRIQKLNIDKPTN